MATLEWRNKWKNKIDLQSKYIPNNTILVFDVETTGLNENSKVIQFSGIKYKIDDNYKLEEMEVFDTYINPNETLRDKITEITGITDDILKDAPSEKNIASTILSLMASADVLVGYNVNFDLEQMKRMAERVGDGMPIKPNIDACELARDFIPKSEIEQHKLGNVVKNLFPNEHFIFHDSLEDVKATAKVLEYLANEYIKLEYETDKIQAHLEKAHIFINPRKPSMQRICLQLSLGEDGDIFYDIVGHYWSCKSTTAAKKLFKQIDMCNIEEQMTKKYITPFHYSGIDELGRSWLKFTKEKRKNS